ncbi:Probable serine/threonine-protein kinase fnkA (FNIP repeat-containing protein A) [Durusdinium trenchii]|uniref:Probable serine/threonine-protein kinase fnkA (FNIP repeat-containing protein A) n=1 Tax=Durusdinium trenchii TaxID=1381693 RepID=A0ABP0QI55_9DINO
MGSAATAELAACPAEDPEDAALLDFLSEDPDRARRLLSLAARAERLMPSVTAPVPARVMRGEEVTYVARKVSDGEAVESLKLVAHWTSLTHEDLRQAAKPCRGTSAGLDGWTTEEVYAFSDDMLATLAAFYNKCESLGQAPAAWKMTRQVHLSKDKKLQSDGSSLAGDLRPFMSETLPVGIPVSSSLPQGDCFSMLAMTCLLLPAVNDIRTREVNVEQVVYADDRSFACATPQQLKRMTEHWTRWAGILGLRENGSKAQYYHARSGGRRDLERIGLPSECISDRIRILGFTFAGLRPRKAGPHEQSRLEEAKAKAARVRCLPGGLKRQMRLAQYAVLPKAAWGVVLPSNMQTLVLGQKFNQSLEGVTLPSTLQTLALGISWPSSLQTLAFGCDFNESLIGVTLPSSLRTLTFDYKFNHSLAGVELPCGLKNLTFGQCYDQTLVDVALPSGLEALTFSNAFDQSLEGVALPSNLQFLMFGSLFNKSLEGVSLPTSLRTLIFGQEFNQSLTQVLLPSNLRNLTFGFSFNQSLEDDFDQNLEDTVLPSSLETLTFGWRFNQSLVDVVLPTSLHTLIFGKFFNQSLEGVTLPGSLKTLSFGDLGQGLDGVTCPFMDRCESVKVHEISAWTLCMCRCALIVAKSSAEERGTRTDRISIARRAWLVVCTVNQFAVRNSETVRPGRAFCCHCETSRAVVCARTGAAQERSLAEGGQNASDGQVQRLLVEAVPALPGFQGAKSGRLFQAKTQEGFRCESGDESLAEDLESIAFRRLELSIDQSTRASSMFGGLLGEPEPELSRLFLIEARVSVLARDDGATPLLMAALDRHESEGPLEVSEDDQFKNDVTVLYDCWRKGSSRVELRLVLAPEVDGPRTEICMAWLKSCGQGFAALQVRHGQSLIFPAPADHAPVPPLLAAEGTLEEVTKLQFSSLGAMRLKMPKVSSDEQLKVEIRGLASADAIEVTTSEVLEISVLYSCLGAGVMEVELALEQAVLSAAHAPEVLHLHWRKRCGDSVYRFVDVYLKSDLNKTQVVSKGTTLPGFMHCPKEAVSGAEDGTKPLTKGTECQPEALEVSPKEVKTTVELRLDPEGHQLPPAFQPHPDLSFDRKILRAYVVQPTSELFRKTQPSSLRANTNAMTVRYSCHKAGVSLIVVTIYVMKHKPIDFAWRKSLGQSCSLLRRCSEPKVHTSKALTAPQAMTFAFLVCGGIGLIVCMVCLFCSGDQDKNQLFQGHRRPGREVEFKPIGASPKVGYEYEEEVMFFGSSPTN